MYALQMVIKKKLLVYLMALPLIGIGGVLITPSHEEKFLKTIGLVFTCLPFINALALWGGFQRSVSSFQYVSTFFWLPSLNLNITFGIDGLSLVFLLLTTFLIPLCLVISWNNVKKNLKEFVIALLLLDFLLVGTFCVLDVLWFYIFFESVLIPMFLIVGIWGSRERKILAAYYLFMYTLLGSSMMLLSIVYVYLLLGTTNYEILLTVCFLPSEQYILWLAFFAAFASKVPMAPLHLWLPEAHVEAPTGGSVVLAGVLLKLGAYGFLRFSLPLFPEASFFFTPFLYSVSILGIIYGSLTAIRQTDLKRVIAYASIAHMNLIILGIFSFDPVGLEGAILQSLSHGFVASALFAVIGIIYDRHRTRVIQYYSGLTVMMPLYAIIFLFFTLANISFPGTSSFVGELMIFVGSFQTSTTVTFLGAVSIVLGGGYSLWLSNRVIFGGTKTQYSSYFLDLKFREFVLLVPLIVGTLIAGVCPDIFLEPTTSSAAFLATKVQNQAVLMHEPYPLWLTNDATFIRSIFFHETTPMVLEYYQALEACSSEEEKLEAEIQLICNALQDIDWYYQALEEAGIDPSSEKCPLDLLFGEAHFFHETTPMALDYYQAWEACSSEEEKLEAENELISNALQDIDWYYQALEKAGTDPSSEKCPLDLLFGEAHFSQEDHANIVDSSL